MIVTEIGWKLDRQRTARKVCPVPLTIILTEIFFRGAGNFYYWTMNYQRVWCSEIPG